MKEKWRACSAGQRVLLLLIAAMVVLFSILYPVTLSQPGLVYQDTLLKQTVTADATVYTGDVGGWKMSFALSGNTVTYALNGEEQAVYTVTADPSALPEDPTMSGLEGVELREGDQVLFRGGWKDGLLVDENGQIVGMDFNDLVITVGGTAWSDEDGPIGPGKLELIRMVLDPQITHRGIGEAYWVGTVVAVLAAGAVLFADALFRFALSRWIQDPEQAEPSDWELFRRRVSWGVLSILALIIYILGLCMVSVP